MNSPYEWLGAWHCPLCNTKRKGFQTTCPCGYDDYESETKANTYSVASGLYHSFNREAQDHLFYESMKRRYTGVDMTNIVKFSNGDDSNSTTEETFVNIEIADNGYILNVTVGEVESRYVYSYDDRKKMMKYLEEVLGV